MLKNILKIAGVKELSKNEQKNVKGGACCNPEEQCCQPVGSFWAFPCTGCQYCLSRDGHHCV